MDAILRDLATEFNLKAEDVFTPDYEDWLGLHLLCPQLRQVDQGHKLGQCVVPEIEGPVIAGCHVVHWHQRLPVA